MGFACLANAAKMNGCEGRVEEAVVGSKASTNCKDFIKPKEGQLWRFREKETNPYQQEHQDLIAAIRAGTPLNDAHAIAESTLTGIMGREAAYTGRTIEREEVLNSKMKLGPEKYEMGDLPFPEVPTPGQHKFT